MHAAAGRIGSTINCLLQRKAFFHCILRYRIKVAGLIKRICHCIVCNKTYIFKEIILSNISNDLLPEHFLLKFKEHTVFNPLTRSEERRVGKEAKCRVMQDHEQKIKTREQMSGDGT